VRRGGGWWRRRPRWIFAVSTSAVLDVFGDAPAAHHMYRRLWLVAGGADDPSNLRAACEHCNTSRDANALAPGVRAASTSSTTSRAPALGVLT
jgi:HNH endonuclease